MVNNLARVRAREAADRWLESKLGDARPEIVGAMAWDRDGLADIFMAGAEWAISPATDADFKEVVVSLVRDAIEAAGDSAPEEAAAIEAAQRIEAYLGAIHREEQDLWAARSKALRDAIRSASLIEDGTGWLKVHGLDNATPLFEILQAAYVAANAAPGDGVPDEENPEADEGWFSRAELAVPAGRKPVGPNQAALLLRAIGLRVEKRGGDYEFDGEIRAVIVKRSGAIRYAVEDDRGLLLVMNASQCGIEAPLADTAAWRKDGVADLAAFRVTTGDPRFDPGKPVSINGFTYHPTKED